MNRRWDPIYLGGLESKAGLGYDYNDPNFTHAVTRLSNGNQYVYEANSNQTKRVIGGDTYDLAYDQENRLVEVKKNSAVIATFVYDGDGSRVKGVVSGTTTTYIGSYYEWTGSTSTMVKYYYAGGPGLWYRRSG